MTRTTVAVAAGSLALLVANAANAADLAQPQLFSKAPPVYHQTFSPTFSWTGFYVGFNAGYGWGSSTLTGAGGSNEVSPDGFLGGSTFGYNIQSGSLVYGIEGDIAYSWMEDTASAAAPCPGCDVRNNYLATVRGRLGYAMNRWMPYVTGGVAIGGIRVSTPAGGSQTDHKVGWTAGAGVEYAYPVWNMSTKLEYLYTDLGTATCDAAHCGAPINADFNAHILRVGVNFRY